MKKAIIILAVATALFCLNTNAQTYKRARIWLDGKSPLQLSNTGIDLTETFCKKNFFYESDFNESELRKVNAAGFRTEILIDDVQKFYREQNLNGGQKISSAANGCFSAPDYPQPANFGYGSMGGFFTYQELLDNLDSMVAKFPNLISAKQPISAQTTFEGRPVYWLRLSDNPNVDETEPEVLYTALHHAREPNGMAAIVYYMWYLMENYATDTAIQKLVDNTEMYFIPCVNPDGYIYNELTDPNGGGMWRKNRKDFTNGIYGVDLNRNYGYNWGFDDNGSSPDSNDITFRGNAPFSEAETQMTSSFCNAHNFKLALNYHTYSNLLINPWGYVPDFYTPDSALYDNYTELLTRYNSYTRGTANQTVGYLVNGSSDDWMYGEQTAKPKIMAMTPEVGDGNDGFWPQQNRIVDLCKENMFANLMTAKLAGRYGIANDQMPWCISQTNGYIKFDFSLLGLDTTGVFSVAVVPVSANISLVGAAKNYTGLNLLQLVSDSISFALAAGVLPGDEIKYLLTVNNGLYTDADTVTKIFGTPVIALNDNANNTANWQSPTQWATTISAFVSSPSSITDSPFGLYNPNSFTEIALSSPVNLVNASAAYLSFYAKWEIENNFDMTQLSISNDNGVNWFPLCGKYTNPGSSFQDPGNPLYDGNQLTWVKEEINLESYTGQNVLFKFALASDGFAEYEGFYFDDFKVEKIVASGVGLQSSENSMVFSLYPNPATESFVLHYNTPSAAEFILYDAVGKKINAVALDENQHEKKIDCTNLSKGIYFYKIKNQHSVTLSHKMVIY